MPQTENTSFVGTAAWTIPKASSDAFPEEGSHLQRYSQILSSVEINSSFYKDHQPKSYLRWANETPANFEFSVKLQKRFTHEDRLLVDRSDLANWFEGVSQLEDKLGAVLAQVPPSLAFNAKNADHFFSSLRRLYGGLIAFEPRHVTWLQKHARDILREFDITRVEADPDPIPLHEAERVKTNARYLRLHGSPTIYRSEYTDEFLEALAFDIKSTSEEKVWIIFDNTAEGHATNDALKMKALLEASFAEQIFKTSRGAEAFL